MYEEMPHFGMLCIGRFWAEEHADGPVTFIAYWDGDHYAIEYDKSQAPNQIRSIAPLKWLRENC